MVAGAKAQGYTCPVQVGGEQFPGRTFGPVEVAVGFGVVALVISYLPILYQAFSRCEVAVSKEFDQ